MSFSQHQKKELTTELNDIISELTTPEVNQRTAKINGVIAGVTNDKETVYLNAKGVSNVETGENMTVDSVVSFFSCTKSITCMGLLKLYEEGKVDLEAPVKKYVPQISNIGVIDANLVDLVSGKFIKPPRKPLEDVTLRHLLNNTAGFSYGFLDLQYVALSTKRDPHINAITPSDALFTNDKMPLLHEPGKKWTYGHSTDWVGKVIENVTGKKLGVYLKDAIFDPIGMNSCTFHVKNTERLADTHIPDRYKNLKVMKKRPLNVDPEIDMGGQGCFGTVGDYLKFIRVWLNEGMCVDTNKQVLKPETVNYARKNHLPPGVVVDLEDQFGVKIPLQYEPDGFTLTGCAYSMNNLPTGRPKGAIYWFGLANLYFWIDFENKVAGFWACQILPVMNMTSITGFMRMEYNVYEALNNSKEETSKSRL
ncbi:uncharacterized protein AC631_02594 [Debaryomyces fabryi]|uniref:Beta-lactamase-related domain-containing protein n=1 Tax=Debaryomyces fabryi TaxID=58627 RepID=A0A0V1PZN3_9ASCO|nr:uncharacterized protein AC631_02594 [Debaryomyces fabryi]KSA01654.1 hypothetical protein AC631_02594 [Debaryomyces fabryi]CUM45407.1 unnamed protein product [Debaryomyces fabryi]